MGQILNNTQEIILASGSPRRRAYFDDLGLRYRVITADIAEERNVEESPEGYTRRLALEKATAVGEKYPEQWVLAADTVVSCEGQILEKPLDGADALQMLLFLRNRDHQVVSSICLLKQQNSVAQCRTVSTTVSFWDFSKEMARAYVETGEPLDKAGSYGIQGQGAFLVREVRGSYSNVVGLPLVECIALLTENKVLSEGVSKVC